MKQKKKFWSMIVCCVMILAICSPVFATDATVDTEIPNMTDEEMDALYRKELQQYELYFMPIYDCPNCPAAQCLALYCVRPMSVSHTSTHSTSSGTCSILWHTATYRYQCTLCGYIEPGTTISGHYCERIHSVCANDSWCRADRVTYN